MSLKKNRNGGDRRMMCRATRRRRLCRLRKIPEEFVRQRRFVERRVGRHLEWSRVVRLPVQHTRLLGQLIQIGAKRGHRLAGVGRLELQVELFSSKRNRLGRLFGAARVTGTEKLVPQYDVRS